MLRGQFYCRLARLGASLDFRGDGPVASWALLNGVAGVARLARPATQDL